MSFAEAARLDAQDLHTGKIDVIVAVRRQTRCGLREAKDACEDTNFDVEKAVALVRERGGAPPSAPTARPLLP